MKFIIGISEICPRNPRNLLQKNAIFLRKSGVETLVCFELNLNITVNRITKHLWWNASFPQLHLTAGVVVLRSVAYAEVQEALC
jgi:hypothetical protein